MAYTVEIANSSTTFEFEVQPEFVPSFQYEYDNSRTPPVLTAIIETWNLRRAAETGTESEVTTKWSDLANMIADRADPISGVFFKRDGVVVFQMTTATHRGVQVSSLQSQVGPGAWKNHLIFDVVVVGRRDVPDGSNITLLKMKLDKEEDAAGLAVYTLEGEIRTAAGTSAEAAARDNGLTAPGVGFGLQTNGEGNVSVKILDYPNDTIAQFKSVWVEHASSLPPNVEEWSFTEETVEGPDGEVTTRQVRARGPSNSSSLSAVRSKKFSAELTEAREFTDSSKLGVTATYVRRRPSTLTQTMYGAPRIVSVRIDVSISGGGRRNSPRPLRGFRPFPRVTAWQPIRLIETVTVQARGVQSGGDIPLPEPLFADMLDGESTEELPKIIDRGLTDDAHLWQAGATRIYNIADPELLSGIRDRVVQLQRNGPSYTDDLDLSVKDTATFGGSIGG